MLHCSMAGGRRNHGNFTAGSDVPVLSGSIQPLLTAIFAAEHPVFDFVALLPFATEPMGALEEI